MTGFKCDKCGKVCETEDDHIVTDEGEYLCMECYKSNGQLIDTKETSTT